MSSPLRSHRIDWDMEEHRANGRLGGTDFITKLGEKIEAPASGRLTMSGSTAIIRQPDGWRTVLLELGTLVGHRIRDVEAGDIIATAGRLYVHAHDIKPGDPSSKHTRSRWLSSTPAPPPKPIAPAHQEDDDMSNMLTYINDGNGRYGKVGAVYYALVLADGRCLDLPDDKLASDLTYAFGVRDTAGKPTGNAYNLTYEQWEFFHQPKPAPAHTTVSGSLDTEGLSAAIVKALVSVRGSVEFTS